MLLQFMARTGALVKREGETVGPKRWVIHKDRLPGARAQNLSASQDGDCSQTPWRGAQPNRWSGLRNPGRGPRADGSNSLTLNLLKNRPSLDHHRAQRSGPRWVSLLNERAPALCALGYLIYESPEPDVIHEPQHQKHRYNIRSAGTHQRQRNARDRHPSHHHSDIHQHVKQQ
jgi:hypothetical protein